MRFKLQEINNILNNQTVISKKYFFFFVLETLPELQACWCDPPAFDKACEGWIHLWTRKTIFSKCNTSNDRAEKNSNSWFPVSSKFPKSRRLKGRRRRRRLHPPLGRFGRCCRCWGCWGTRSSWEALLSPPTFHSRRFCR